MSGGEVWSGLHVIVGVYIAREKIGADSGQFDKTNLLVVLVVIIFGGQHVSLVGNGVVSIVLVVLVDVVGIVLVVLIGVVGIVLVGVVGIVLVVLISVVSVVLVCDGVVGV